MYKSILGAKKLTKLIIKLFVDNKIRPTAERRLRIGTVGGFCGITVNLLLAVMKLIAGLLFGSIAITADSINNMTDAISSVITLIGFKLSGKKPDTDHPYGHGRIEYISGLAMAFVVLMLGITLVKSAVDRIIHPQAIVFSYLTVAVLVISILAKLWMALFYKKLSKLTDSKTFDAASADSRNDCLSTFAVLLSTVIYAIWQIDLDGYIGLAVSLFIVVSGIGLIKETLDPLLGQPPSKELVDEITERTLKHDGVIGIHDLVVHNYGPGRLFASLHVEVPAYEDLLKSHDMIDNIEKEFLEEMHLEMVIHIDPVVTDDPYVNTLKNSVLQILSDINPNLSMHDFRAVTGPTHTNLIFDVVLPHDYSDSTKILKQKIDNKLQKDNPDCFTVITFDRSYI